MIVSSATASAVRSSVLYAPFNDVAKIASLPESVPTWMCCRAEYWRRAPPSPMRVPIKLPPWSAPTCQFSLVEPEVFGLLKPKETVSWLVLVIPLPSIHVEMV